MTETGQISTSLAGETVFSINRKETLPLLGSLWESRKEMSVHIPVVVNAAARLSGFQTSKGHPSVPVYRGRYQRNGYTLEKWGLQGEGEYIIPMLVGVPEGDGPFPAVIYAHSDGKAEEALPGGEIEQLVHRGFLVAAADLLGFGETTSYRNRGHGPVQSFYNAQMAGRSVVGINAGDALRVFAYLRGRPDVREDHIGAVAIGATGPAMLHAAAFKREIGWLVLVRSIQSYESIVLNALYRVNANSLVAGALTAYDLPDLIGSLAPRRIALVNPVDYAGNSSGQEVVRTAASFPLKSYRHMRVEENLRIVVDPNANLSELVQWSARPR